MNSRGRKSTAQLAVVNPAKGDAPLQFLRIAPAEDFSPRELEVWQSIVDSLPSEWFTPGDAPLLNAYCRAIALYEKASAKLAKQQLVVKGKRNPLYAIVDSLARQMAMLAVKLRLTQSTRTTDQKASTKSKATPHGAARPWAKQA